MTSILRRLFSLPRRVPAADENYEPELTGAIERVVQPGWICADVGAHVGNITETLVRLVGKHGRVIAFEAHPANAAELEDRFRRAPEVEIVNAAVSDGSSDRLALYAGRHDHSTEWNVVGHDVDGVPTRRELEVQAVSLDTWFAPGERLDFVKIDVEGAEDVVLRGLAETLERAQPILLLERSSAAAEVDELLRARGYAPHVYDGRRLQPFRSEQVTNVFYLPS